MKIDFHTHTNFSWDGFSSPEEVIDMAIERNIDCICITDHEEIKGAIRAMKYAFDKNILVVPGIEITSRSGDILGINIKKVIPAGLSAKETIEKIHKQRGIAIIPHPFNWPAGSFVGEKKDFLLADGVEIFNAGCFGFTNKKAVDLSKKMNLCFTAGSDAHRAKFIGRGYLEIPKNILSEKELTEEVKKKTGYIRGKTLNFKEILQNSLKMNPRKIFNYYNYYNGVKPKNRES